MISVLFVDDEPAVLNGLRNRLHGLRSRWDMHFAEGGAAALEAMERRPFDAVVSDMRMPGLDGAALLEQVRVQHPKTVRLILTGHPGEESALKLLPVAQEILYKPCDAGTLETTVERCCALYKRLNDPRVLDAIGTIKKLPALPRLYWDLVRELDNPDSDSRSVAAIIEQDISMTARILQVANSSYFFMGRPLHHVREAVTTMGLLSLRSLVLSMQMFNAMSEVALPPGFSLARLQQHSMRVAQIASGLPSSGEERQVAFAAGVLHDIGKLVFAVGMPDQWIELRVHASVNQVSRLAAERQVFGCTHAEVGAHLLSIWRLPTHLIEAVAYHHAPARQPRGGFGAAGAIHVANALSHEDNEAPAQLDAPSDALDAGYLRSVGVPESLDEWRGKAAQVM